MCAWCVSLSAQPLPLSVTAGARAPARPTRSRPWCARPRRATPRTAPRRRSRCLGGGVVVSCDAMRCDAMRCDAMRCARPILRRRHPDKRRALLSHHRGAPETRFLNGVVQTWNGQDWLPSQPESPESDDDDDARAAASRRAKRRRRGRRLLLLHRRGLRARRPRRADAPVSAALGLGRCVLLRLVASSFFASGFVSLSRPVFVLFHARRRPCEGASRLSRPAPPL